MKTLGDRVYEYLRNIPRGTVVTYKDIARALGIPRASRAVGTILGKNPNIPVVPCHRVVRADGKVGGYAHGPQKKISLLISEGVSVKNGSVSLATYRWRHS